MYITDLHILIVITLVIVRAGLGLDIVQLRIIIEASIVVAADYLIHAITGEGRALSHNE